MDIAPPTDPLAAVSHPDPYAYYAELATSERPDWDDRLGLWIVANPAHVAQIMRHPDAHVVPPTDAPPGFAEYARFNEGERHARLRAEVIERIETVSPDEPVIALDDLDAFVENYALYALARDMRSNVKGDLLFQSYDAVRALIGNALVALARDATLGADGAVAYALALDPPVHNTRRKMVADLEIAGATLRSGDTALIVLVSTTFGTGRHACPGESLSVRIALMALRRILASDIRPRKPIGYLPRPNVRTPIFGARKRRIVVDPADVAYVRESYRAIAEADIDRALPAPSYYDAAGMAYVPRDYITQERSRERFYQRARLEIARLHLNYDRAWIEDVWTAYGDGIYGICLREATPETIVNKNALVDRIRSLETAETKDEDWKEALRTAVDRLDTLERPFCAFDRNYFGGTVTRDTCITAMRARFLSPGGTVGPPT